MSDAKNKRKGDGRDKARRRYRSDGTPIWGQRAIDGPGIWVTCVRNKEKSTVGELYDLFETLAAQTWPDGTEKSKSAEGESDEEDDGDIEKAIAKEMASIKRPRKEQRFANCQTDTQCLVIISCKPPVDPVQLVLKHVQNVIDTGVTNTRFTQRLTPISGTCVANLPEIRGLFNRVIKPFFEADPVKKYTYKIELRMRHHNTITRMALIEEIAKCMPEGHKVSMAEAEVFILVEVFKAVCGMSVVKDYYRLQKFNVMEIANAKSEDAKETGRVSEKTPGDGGALEILKIEAQENK